MTRGQANLIADLAGPADRLGDERLRQFALGLERRMQAAARGESLRDALLACGDALWPSLDGALDQRDLLLLDAALQRPKECRPAHARRALARILVRHHHGQAASRINASQCPTRDCPFYPTVGNGVSE
jgi:hypothetical protein